MSNSTDTQLTLGDKIRNFRKRAGLSQLELEVEIDASPGSVSRLEAGKVNPTKETILQLAKTLKLNGKELSDLMGVKPLLPTQEEIESAITECKGYLDKEEVIAYLLDENGIMYYTSQGFKKLLSLTDEHISRLIGKGILEIALDPSLGILQYLDYEKNKKVFAIEIIRIGRESNIASEYMEKALAKLPLINEILAIASTISTEEILSNANKQVFFNINGKQIVAYYSREKLKNNSRFEIIEYINPRPY